VERALPVKSLKELGIEGPGARMAASYCPQLLLGVPNGQYLSGSGYTLDPADGFSKVIENITDTASQFAQHGQ